MVIMLVEFTLKNFRSFRKEATLSMEAESLKSNTNKLIKAQGGTLCLPSAGVFGGNASGKSNIFKALGFMAWAMQNTDYIKSPTTEHDLLSPFRLNQSSAGEPSLFQIVLWDPKAGREYTYGFEINDRAVLSEHLSVKSKVSKNFTSSLVFSRDKQKFKFGSRWGAGMKQLEKRVRPDALALSVFAQFNDQLSLGLVDLVSGRFLHIDNDLSESMRAALRACEEDGQLLANVTKMVRQADLGIGEIFIEKVGLPESFGVGFGLEAAEAFGGDSRFGIKRVRMSHSVYGQAGEVGDVVFDLDKDESAGTGRLFVLATHISRALKSGGVLVVDDLDSNLHPFIVKALVDQFDNKETNPKDAQLIYSTHEAFLMSRAVNLRRDQIWLTEKNEREESELIRLSDYKIRDDYRIDRNYMAGRFGGVPQLEFKEPDSE